MSPAPRPATFSLSFLRAGRLRRVLALLALCAFAGGCATQKKETVDYGFGMQFQQTPP